MQTTIVGEFRVNGVLTTADSVVLRDADDTYGVKRLDTDAVVVASGTAMVEGDTGVYSYTFTDPAADLEYQYVIEVTYNGVTTRETGTKPGTVSGAGNVYDTLGIVQAILPNCPVNLIKQYLRLALVDFCEKTEIWSEELAAIASVADQEDYTITHGYDAAIKRIWKVEMEEVPWNYTVDNECATISMDPIPAEASQDIVPFVIFVPKHDSTDVPDWLMDRWGQYIAYGAIARLCMVDKRPWTSAGTAREFGMLYSQGIARAMATWDSGRSDNDTRVKLRRFV